MADAYREYWQTRNTPEWGSSDPAHFRLMAAELMLLCPPGTDRMLEIGCGTGSLYPFLTFSTYRGVDFSISMLDVFRRNHPEASLICAEGATYREPNSRYDVIFTNGVIQHFDLPMLRSHFEAARSMMSTHSVLISGSVPWKSQYLQVTSGLALGLGRQRQFWKAADTLVRGPGFGRWYSRKQIAGLAADAGLKATFFGSMSYPYRFHAVMVCA